MHRLWFLYVNSWYSKTIRQEGGGGGNDASDLVIEAKWEKRPKSCQQLVILEG